MSDSFRPSLARMQRSMKIINSTKTNATIRDLEEEEGELEEKQGTVVSIDRDKINGAGWTVKDTDGQIYICSCANSMYEIPEGTERGGILYPSEKITVTFTVNPVLKINTIKEITSMGKETKKLDISKWQHGDKSTTVIAKPKSAISISDGFVTMNYNNDNQILASPKGVSTEGQSTNINTSALSINSDSIDILGTPLEDFIEDQALDVSNDYKSFSVASPSDVDIITDRSNNMTQVHISSQPIDINAHIILGQIMDQKSIPVRIQTQQLLTDGNCIDIITIDTDGVISVSPATNNSCTEPRKILSTNNWITPQVQSRNYIKVTVKETCDECDDGNNTVMEYVNYCPSCNNWNTLYDTGTSIRCSCGRIYCQNCGNEKNTDFKLKKFNDNDIGAYGTTCKHCKDQLSSGTTKYYINYCPNCQEWGVLYQSEYTQDDSTINVLMCTSCDSVFCSSCGIDQNNYGLTITNAPVQYTSYKKALRKLKYVRDGA